MNLDNILDNDQNKLIFLKAIMLGINYGKSDKINYYIDNIEKEINKITNKKVEEKILYRENKNIILEKNNINDKYEKNILFLENQKKYILSLIQKLSLTHYGYNYSRINLLKNNLILINNEIEKKKILIKKNNDDKKLKEKQSINNRDNNNIFLNNILRKNENYQNNENIYFKRYPEKKDNLINELEQTLGGLSALLIN